MNKFHGILVELVGLFAVDGVHYQCQPVSAGVSHSCPGVRNHVKQEIRLFVMKREFSLWILYWLEFVTHAFRGEPVCCKKQQTSSINYYSPPVADGKTFILVFCVL